MQVIVHGGAGTAPTDPDARQQVLNTAADDAARQQTPLDAVETALRALERDERFNAGRGGAIQSDGVPRVDAGVMTSGRDVGAVTSLTGVAHPSTVARAVCEETPHVLLAGGPAESFASAIGVETDVDLTTAATRERFAAADPPDGGVEAQLDWARSRFDAAAGGADPTVGDHDTVGAVARTGDRFAAATSTGGRWFALAGRVGDVPQVGSGFYCSPAGGASATGSGEDIARTTLARQAVERLEAGADAETAASDAIDEFERLTGAEAGLVVLGSGDGEAVHGSAFNSEAMQTAVAER